MNQNEEGIIKVPFAKDPVNFGDYDPSKAGGYNRLNRCNLFGCEYESLIDGNTNPPAVWDGGEIITTSEGWRLVLGNPEAWLMTLDKPASTGTTGDYPYNGMGRVVLPKNIKTIDGVEKNYLEQSMMPVATGGNTVYVIRYDYTLAEDIIIPESCILEFNGGSVDGDDTFKLFQQKYVWFINPHFKNLEIGIDPLNIGYAKAYGISNYENCKENRVLITNDDRELCFDLRDLPGPLSKYNLQLGETVEDNAEKLNALFLDGNYDILNNTYSVALTFSSSHEANAQWYVFKDPISISTRRWVKFIVNNNIKFDLSKYSYRTIEQITNNVPKLSLVAISLSTIEHIEIIGGAVKGHTTPQIDFGESTIQGDYYSDVTINGHYYDSTDTARGIYVMNSNYVHIENIWFKNFFGAVDVEGIHGTIENCIFSDGCRDNGLSVIYPHETHQTEFVENGRFIVRNCFAKNIKGLGFSAQGKNILFENCVARNCGNDFVNSQNYGVHDSRVAGGGFSIENLRNGTDASDMNVAFIGCKAIDCYNYGFGGDSGGVKFIGCEVHNIATTVENREYPIGTGEGEHLYTSLPLRAGSAFMLETQYIKTHQTAILNPWIIEGCIIENVKFVSSVANGMINNVLPLIFSNCYINNVTHNAQYIETEYAKEIGIISDSLVNDINDNYDQTKVRYVSCYNTDMSDYVQNI